MFTVPVGLYNPTSIYYRPTASSVVLSSGTYAVTNAAYAYDTNPDTYCEVSATAEGAVQLVYSGFSVISVKNPTINVLCFGIGTNACPNVYVSTDNGSTYPYSINLNVVQEYDGLNTTSSFVGPGAAAKGIASLVIPGTFTISNIKVKINLSASAVSFPPPFAPPTFDAKFYDINISV